MNTNGLKSQTCICGMKINKIYHLLLKDKSDGKEKVLMLNERQYKKILSQHKEIGR